MTPTELKAKYPNASKMIDNLTIPTEGTLLHSIWGNKTIHGMDDGKFFFNDKGLKWTVFPNLETVIKWFYGNETEQNKASENVETYYYSTYLSSLTDGCEVSVDKDGNVAFCDFTNDDFTPEQLAQSKLED